MNINEYIRNRRSHFVKEFTGEKLPDEVVHQMIENAHWAPSHKLTLPWQFAVYTGESLVSLCTLMEELYRTKTPSEKFNADKLKKIQDYPAKISHIISIGMKRHEIIPEWEEIASIGAAVQNMYLTLSNDEHACGYWTSGNGTGTDEVKKFTGLDSEDRHLGYFFLGHIEEKRTEAMRETSQNHFTWNS